MTRRRLIVISSALALLTLSSVSFDWGRTLRVTAFDGTPAAEIYVVYHHEGSRPNLVHPVTYEASRRSVAHSSTAGSVDIPSSFHVHWPFPAETHPRLRVDLVYVPMLHNGHATVVESAVAHPGISSVAADLATIQLADLSDHPSRWEGTLRNLSWITGRLIDEQSRPAPRRRARPETAALTRVLAAHFVQEYEAFRNRYGAVARPRPEMAPALQYSTEMEKKAWHEMVDRDLAREPLWGDVAQRLFAIEAQRLARFANSDSK